MTGIRTSDSVHETDPTGVSSLIDTWIMVNTVRSAGETLRTVSIAKSRGMDHSNQVRRFEMSKTGIHFLDVFQDELRSENARTAHTVVRNQLANRRVRGPARTRINE